MNQQRQKLHDLQTLIDNLGSGQETVSDKAFEDRLKEAERAIMELLEEAQTSKGNTTSTVLKYHMKQQHTLMNTYVTKCLISNVKASAVSLPTLKSCKKMKLRVYDRVSAEGESASNLPPQNLLTTC